MAWLPIGSWALQPVARGLDSPPQMNCAIAYIRYDWAGYRSMGGGCVQHLTFILGLACRNPFTVGHHGCRRRVTPGAGALHCIPMSLAGLKAIDRNGALEAQACAC